MHRDMRNVYKIMTAKPEGERPLIRPRRKWEDNMKTDFKEIEWRV
jgi:hypothetical protein